MKRLWQTNQIFGNENAGNCDYKELKKLNMNRHHDVYLLHLNISPLSLETDEKTFS